MNKDCRIRFCKTGIAKYISHLDLMRTMQRCFIRAGVSIKHTEGFNPHPYMNFAIPLSVGCESVCELMDFALTDSSEQFDLLPEKLTRALPEGIAVLEAYSPQNKFKEIQWIRFSGTLEYDSNVSEEELASLCALYRQPQIIVPKKTKKGISDTDIAPMIKSINLTADGKNIAVNTVLPAQNPSLNPEYLVHAIELYLPEIVPDIHVFRREELLNGNIEHFR